MKFLIDECLHTSLVTLAHEAGHLCDHVNFLGLGGHKDWQLMTKNPQRGLHLRHQQPHDFTSLCAKEELHSGLVIIIPNVTPSRQRELFRASLLHIGTRNLTNTVLEVDLADDTATCREYPIP